jgi:predicted DNA-binding protein (MmcQ/YjbR family)
MIDYATYKKIHAGESKKSTQRSHDDDLGPEVMSRDEPPQDAGFLLCLPKTIPGFNMNKKEWSSFYIIFVPEIY